MWHIRALAVLAVSSFSIFNARAAELVLTEALRGEVVSSVIEQLETAYVLPERGAIAAAELRHRLDTGYFEGINNPQIFANRITGIMDVISDWHLWVNYHPKEIPEDYVSWQFSNDAQRISHLRRRNFGFEKFERLPGNIGYIELREFHYEEGESERALADIMSLNQHTHGLIIDLRRNGGGAPEMVELLASYFLEPGTHLGDILYSDTNRVVASFTREDVAEYHYGTKRPLYLLMSESTFSGAEGFGYTLQVLERATLVGEKMRGGAHLFEDVRLHEHFMMALPIARSVNPITQSSWQYIGVRPDIEVSADQALREAHRLLLEGLIATTSDDTVRAEQRFVLDSL